MWQPKQEVANVLEALGNGVEHLGLNNYQLRCLRAIKECRTYRLGGHIDQCTCCSRLHISYNSCRNRHCPKCQGYKKEQWIQARTKELLPVPYFHSLSRICGMVFTLPSSLHGLCMQHPAMLYDALLQASWQTLSYFFNAAQVQGGAIMVLHTWGQQLGLHPHVHCIVPGGGTTSTGSWQTLKQAKKFLFPVKGMRKVFRAKYVSILRSYELCSHAFTQSLFSQDWVVYAKRPFGGPPSVVEYLGRYTHKVAISNHRLQSIEGDKVSFTYKDYKDGAKQKMMQLSVAEFTRRFALHILPKRFTRIRHYGILSSTWKRSKLAALQQSLKVVALWQPPPLLHNRCRHCKQGVVVTVCTFDRRGPPTKYLTAIHLQKTHTGIATNAVMELQKKC
jgi:Putative transposase/Transposase zinc-binding domain